MDDELIPLAELVNAFHRSRATLYRWADTGSIPARRIGSSWYMHRDDVKRYLSSSERIHAELDSRKAMHGVILNADDLSLIVNALQDSLTRIRHARRNGNETARH